MKLTSIEQVQQRVGKLSAPRDLKVIDYIDEHAQRWLSYSRFAFIGLGKAGSVQLSAAGGEAGFACVVDEKHLSIPVAALDESSALESDCSFGALFMVSGMEETLRVNGAVSAIADGQMTLQVEECYLHCAKALKRSNFWQPDSLGALEGDASHLIQQSKFMALASINAAGQVDVSPKGDPENFLIQEQDSCICFADRPGNRRIDSFRNILEQPQVSVIAIVPGYASVLEITGTAGVYADDPLLEKFAVKGKTPKVMTKITASTMSIKLSQALATSALWTTKAKPDDLKPAEIFKAHIQQSKEQSLQARVARAAVSVPGAMKTGLEADYKKNLY